MIIEKEQKLSTRIKTERLVIAMAVIFAITIACLDKYEIVKVSEIKSIGIKILDALWFKGLLSEIGDTKAVIKEALDVNENNSTK